MVGFLDAHEKVVAVTGRQRVMTEYNQRVLGRAARGEPVEKDSLFESCLRLLQACRRTAWRRIASHRHRIALAAARSVRCDAALRPAGLRL
jgi:hypothetical protein